MRNSVSYSVAPPKPETGQMLNDDYVLGAFLGKGAFGTVYECQNVHTGEIYAVKRVPLSRLTPKQRESLAEEVRFLEMLNHPNIVKYICSVKQMYHYNIVLQLMENGSLAQIMKKVGAFSPLLSSIYIRQVLLGLQYLHEHGVIHRDIKGANILSDKYGRVKLADFGVAIFKEQAELLGGEDSNLGVGTVYWMAPEVIPNYDEKEMPTPTTAYDVWSLGCTVIELLTMHPPWSDLNPNAAVTRMATQDIPIPDSFALEIRDFLSKCFVRDPKGRSTATQLLEHEWISKSAAASSARLSALTNKTAGEEQLSVAVVRASEVANEDPEEAPLTPQLLARSTSAATVAPASHTAYAGKSSITSLASSASAYHYQHRPHSMPGQIYDHPGEMDSLFPSPQQQQQPGDGGFLLPRQSVIRRSASNSLFPLGENVQVNGRYPNSGLQQGGGGGTGARSTRLWSMNDSSSSNLLLVDPYEAMAQQAGNRNSRFSQFKEQPDDFYFADMTLEEERQPPRLSLGGGGAVVNSELQLLQQRRRSVADFPVTAPRHGASTTSVDSSVKSARIEDLISKLLNLSSSSSSHNNGSGGANSGSTSNSNAGGGVTTTATANSSSIGGSLQHDIEQTCDQLVRFFREDASLKQVMLAHPCGLSPLVEILNLAALPPADTRALLRLVAELASNDRAIQELLCMVGLVPVLAKLAGKDQEFETRRRAGACIAHFLQTTPLTLHLFVACGGVQAIIALLDSKGEAAPSIELAIVAVDGVQRIFSETVAPPGSHRRASMARALLEAEKLGSASTSAFAADGAGLVPKNDFCYMFSKTPLLERLASLGHRLQTEEGRKECPKNMISPSGFLAEVCHIFSVFSTGSQQTKLHLAHSSKSLRFILQTASSRWAAAAGSTEIVPEDEVDVYMDSVRALISTLKNLASESSCLDALDAAGVIQSLIPFLSLRTLPNEASLESSTVARRLKKRRELESIANAIPEIHDVCLVTLYYLCHLNASRQERAAVAGIIPCAMIAIRDRTMVKTFALQLLVEMSQSTDLARNCLFRDKAVDFFLDLIKSEDADDGAGSRLVDGTGQRQALFALSQFVSVEDGGNSEFERSLLRPFAIQRILHFFARSGVVAGGKAMRNEVEFQDTCKILLFMMESSSKMCEALSRCGFLVTALVDRLGKQEGLSIETKLALLRLLDLTCKHQADPASFLLEHNLLSLVKTLGGKSASGGGGGSGIGGKRNAEAQALHAAMDSACAQLAATFSRILEV